MSHSNAVPTALSTGELLLSSQPLLASSKHRKRWGAHERSTRDESAGGGEGGGWAGGGGVRGGWSKRQWPVGSTPSRIQGELSQQTKFDGPAPLELYPPASYTVPGYAASVYLNGLM